MHSYTVQKGESSRSVAEKFGVNESALLRENTAPFYEGQQVVVPVRVMHIASNPPSLLQRCYQIPDASILESSDHMNIIF